MVRVLRYRSLRGCSMIAAILLTLVFSADAMARPLRIVATTTDLAAIATAIAGPRAEVKSLTSGREDPHFLQAKPSYIAAARQADLWIRVGMDLEVGWEPPILESARNQDIRPGAPGHLDASEHVLRLDVPTTRVTRAMGDVHPHGNPHYWLDPLNGRIIAKSIAERLALRDPANAGMYQSNLQAFQEALDTRMFGETLVAEVGGARLWALLLKGELDRHLADLGLGEIRAGWRGELAPYMGKDIVSQHRSWVYFTHRFGLVIAAELEPKPGIPPGGAHLKTVIRTIGERGTRLILIAPYYGRKAADMVGKKTGARVRVCANSVGGEPGATDYLALMDLIVNRVSAGLSD